MFSLAHNIVKAKQGFFHVKHRNDEFDDDDDQDINNPRTFEKMAKDEKNNKNITEDKYFFNKLNDIFQKFLGPTLRRQYNYFLCEKFVEESILKSLDSIDQEELSDYAIKILRKDIDKRLFEEILILQKITENVEAFKHIRAIKGREVLFTCLKNLRYKYGKMGSFLQRQDEPVRSLFIVIKGLVQVKTVTNKESNTPRNNLGVSGFSNQQKQFQNREQYAKANNYLQKHKLQRKQSKLQKKFSFQESLEELNSQGKIKCVYLNKGQSYGDKYILAQDDTLAENQAYLFDNCHLAYLDIMKFKTILDERVLLKLQKEIAEFSEMNLINQLDHKFVSALYIRTKMITLKRKNLLTIENENADYVYFIKEGEVKLTKKLIYDQTKNPKKDEKIEPQHNSNLIQGTYQIPHQKIQNFELAILVKGQFIGLEEFFRDQPYQSSSFIYSTEATLYQIHRYELQQLLSIHKPVRDQIMEYFEQQQEKIDHRQERVSNYNQYTGKIDTKTKKLEEQLEKLQSVKSDDEIKKNILEGQEMIIKSSISINIKPQNTKTNLEFIKSSIQQKDPKYMNKKKKKQEIFMGCQFSEQQLENLQRNVFASSKNSSRLASQNFDSPTKLNPSQNKLDLMSKSTTNLMQTLHVPVYSPNKQKSLQKLDQKNALLEISEANLHKIKEKYPSTFTHITHIDNDQDSTDHFRYSTNLTERDSTQPLQSKSVKNLQINRKHKLKLDPIIISQSTQVSQHEEKKNVEEHLNNSIQQNELRSPTSILEMNSDLKKRLNIKLKLQAQTERIGLDNYQQDSSRYKSYFNESTINTKQNMNSIDAFQIKSFTQILNYNQTNTPFLENLNLNNQIQQDTQINNSQQFNKNFVISRKNSQEMLELYASPPKTTRSKINFNRIHSRLELGSTQNFNEKDFTLEKRSHSTKNQFLPLKYRVKDIVESKDSYQTMYKDNVKRTKLYQQTKNYFKSQNPNINSQTVFNQ